MRCNPNGKLCEILIGIEDKDRDSQMDEAIQQIKDNYIDALPDTRFFVARAGKRVKTFYRTDGNLLIEINTLKDGYPTPIFGPRETLGAANDELIKAKNVEVPKAEEELIEKKEINVSVSNLLAQSLDNLSQQFGRAIPEGDGFRFDKLANVILFVEDGVVRSVVARSAIVDIYGVRVGQSTAEIAQQLGDPEVTGMDEESGQYLSQYKLNADTNAFFFSEDENKPTTSVFVSYSPIELAEEEQPVAASVDEAPSEKANVIANFAGIDDDKVYIDVTNAGTTPVKNVSVKITVSGINPLDKNTSRGTYAMADRIEQGQTKRVKILIMSSEMRTITDVEIQGITASVVKE